ncbi:sn-glycerol 3-phosphate transport system ATP-binding protein [Enhydrobacter aerosaccus]|uniref:sn-glycerol 3-phosphate transport system ATP-binding protein n=1 Tax=Enhydrobacter aerosaccus TaxID=225324 RepID=A0A1T4TFX4_9HYPH|nr:ABC transporter ATP-binding protein [Enhydrobacter aerosaccus]SKA39395.1 sn-glycerol 3-phosphate transport system ATP-binding protein [Enhydrobacter aerosaccus]
MSRIEVEHLVKDFGGRAAVNDVSFSVERGALCVLLGPSGCGKSTTLRLIAGLEEPTAGRIVIDGRDITHLPSKDRRIAMVFQSYALFPHLTVAQNIVFGLEVRGVARAERDARLGKVAALVGLSEYLTRKPGQLSGGQRQRVALARAIVSEQPVCLMDEPLSNLDAKLRQEMRVEIRALQQRLGMTMIYVTHDQVEAMTMADQVILMKDGAIEQAGSPVDLYQAPATVFAARFVGAPPMNLIAAAGPEPSVVTGVRAEDMRLAPPTGNGADAEVTSIEYLGADTIVGLRRSDDGDAILVRVPGRASARIGERAALAWDPAHEHRFDRASGRRLSAFPPSTDRSPA